jgi:hypothetical protein
MHVSLAKHPKVSTINHEFYQIVNSYLDVENAQFYFTIKTQASNRKHKVKQVLSTQSIHKITISLNHYFKTCLLKSAKIKSESSFVSAFTRACKQIILILLQASHWIHLPPCIVTFHDLLSVRSNSP